MQEELTGLLSLALRHITGRQTRTSLDGVSLHRAEAPTSPVSGLYQPVICFILQGAKEVAIGERHLRYAAGTCFVASVELPATGWICEASAGQPYVAISMSIDRLALAAILVEAPARRERSVQGFAVCTLSPDLLGSLRRLLGLLDTPQDIAVLGPLVQREILYRLLQTSHADMLRQLARADSNLSKVHRAIGWIRSHYEEALDIQALAQLAGMSRASLHRHFKTVTAMSPLQYQKTMRLQEARRLLVLNPDAQVTGYSVGYTSASQFSREYTRLFGLPPGRHAARLRASVESEALPIA